MPWLYLVTDRELIGNRPLEEVVLEAVRGGVKMVQLREKRASTRQYVELAERLHALLRPLGVPLIINDRVDVALAVGAEGVHIGQQDMPYEHARRLLGPEAIIGLSVESMEELAEAEAYEVSYLSISPVFPTPTKTDTKGAWGLEGLAEARRRSRHRLVAIGGIGPHNVRLVLEAGANGIAVVSAICAAPDPREAAQALQREIERFETERASWRGEQQR
ncbi:MAG: thiamine phosphate synthase [Bacteroidetes bacterium]|nr:thiamine phosphate synthase [Rhodothermia bacterium]MCS7154282.1 thiamine phosphate synthase [Bacteroidota bacterium]MCX7906682.1 thiamine phosphate synthase [Bacteroidota bacterium]MDW8285091.1 thiamine phosphate synthase [Bacteroidota bacterium]